MAEGQELSGNKLLVNEILKNYDLFRELCTTPGLPLSELAKGLDMDIGNLSKLVTRLRREGLVETTAVSRERGRPFRIVRLNEKIRPVIASLMSIGSPPQLRYNKARIDICLDGLEDEGIDEETLYSHAKALRRMFSSNPVEALVENDRVRTYLEKFIQSPPLGGRIGKEVGVMLRLSMGTIAEAESTEDWVIDHVCPQLLGNISDKKGPDDLVIWSISILETIGLTVPDPAVRNGILEKLKALYFTPYTEAASEVGKALARAILALSCIDSNSLREFHVELRGLAKSSDSAERERARELLRKLAEEGYIETVNPEA